MPLEKPFCFPQQAINNDVPVNLELMITFNKKETPDVRNKSRIGDFSIVFQTKEVAIEGQTIEWRYKDKTCRDADYDTLKQKVSVTLTSN